MESEQFESVSININNDGQELVDTNYWQTPFAKDGLCFLSWNAYAARLLVPKASEALLTEMVGSSFVIISSGIWMGHKALEIFFEDNSESPFSIHIMEAFTDRILPPTSHGNSFTFSVWTEAGKQLAFEGKYRVVNFLPCLEAWHLN
jgi:hypothetical protein